MAERSEGELKQGELKLVFHAEDGQVDERVMMGPEAQLLLALSALPASGLTTIAKVGRS